MDAATFDAILDAVANGASPALACRRLGVVLEDFQLALEADPDLRDRWARVLDGLAGNVLAVLYRQAVGGSVPAIAQWLKVQPPRDWQNDAADRTDPTDELATLDGLEDVLLPAHGRSQGVEVPQPLSDVLSQEGV